MLRMAASRPLSFTQSEGPLHPSCDPAWLQMLQSPALVPKHSACQDWCSAVLCLQTAHLLLADLGWERAPWPGSRASGASESGLQQPQLSRCATDRQILADLCILAGQTYQGRQQPWNTLFFLSYLGLVLGHLGREALGCGSHSSLAVPQICAHGGSFPRE